MRIELHLPRGTEARVQIDERRGLIVIEPLFSTSQAVQPFAYAHVVGKKGRERRYVLCAAGRNGRLINQEVKDVDTDFDTGDDVDVDVGEEHG